MVPATSLPHMEMMMTRNQDGNNYGVEVSMETPTPEVTEVQPPTITLELWRALIYQRTEDPRTVHPENILARAAGALPVQPFPLMHFVIPSICG